MPDQLRKAAQAVLAELDKFGEIDKCHDGLLVEALRQALVEPVEPVLYVISDPDGFVPVRPIDALIAEEVAKEREACAQICDPYTHGQWFAKHIRARGQK